MAASMALQVVVSPFLGVLFDNITSPIYKEFGLLWGVDSELKKLASTLSALQSVLADAEEKQLTSKVIADWLLKLKDAAYDADDILDEWTTESGGTQHEHTSRVCTSLLSCFSLEQIKFRHKIAKKMKELNQRFADIASERSMFDLREGVVARRDVDPYRMTGSIPTESKIYGRDEEKAYIIEWLLNNANGTQDLSIRSILGIGGLGKTTLAQAVFNDDRVREHFNVKIWVCVSNDFDLIKLTRAVLDSIPGSSCNSEQLDPLQRSLQKGLSGKHFLLVLDDVWNENQEEWNRFKSSLECGAKGSSILVTTRLKTVASITGTCPHYPLKLLSEEDCWALFKQRAFGDGNEEKSNLLKIGKEIVQKCGGVPLAAKVLGGLLRFKAKESEWLYVKDNTLLDLPQSNDNTILPALKLSYNHLSPDLRQCFAFCSIFPQDYVLEKKLIINLWMANGLLQHREGKQMEDTGDEIVESLVWRSLFQVSKRDEEGCIKDLAMHDLVHDLACSVAKNECCNVDCSHQNVDVPKGIRHLHVSFKMIPPSTMFQSIHQSTPKLRTLILYVGHGIKLPLSDVWSTFKCLRALSVCGHGTELLAESIGNLKHLRYLDLSWGSYKYLPESICGLRNLQTLKLMDCDILEALPKSLSNLSSLRHLDISYCSNLCEMPKDMGRMTCLQTLSFFIVGSNKGQYITELGTMDNLRGELEIRSLEKVRSGRDAEGANLMKKRRLRTLSLKWSYDRTTEEEENDKEVIEGLRPDSNMRRVYIENYKGIRFPSWLEYSFLPNLVEIGVIGCIRCEALPPSLERLPLLKKLWVTGMPLVKTLYCESAIDSDEEVNRFPSLEILMLWDMPELEEWWSFTRKDGSEEQMFLLPTLKHLKIENIPKLTRLPTSPSLETLKLRKCNEMVLGSLVKNLPCLSRLEIMDFDEVVCFPEGSLQNLIALERMFIRGLKKLKILPREAGDLSKLVELEVERCDELVSFPQVGKNCLRTLIIIDCKSLTNLRGIMNGCQTTLRYLSIIGCPKLEWSSLQFEHLTSIESLKINGFPEMTSLPNGIQHLSSTLQTLALYNLDSLSSLPQWMGSLTQLWTLKIFRCKKLRMLPDGLRQLTNLRKLDIRSCHPDLHRSCKSREGEDWHKISHIPDLHIN